MSLFVCRSGLMPGAEACKGYRDLAWTRMTELADETNPHLPPGGGDGDPRHTNGPTRAGHFCCCLT